MWKDWLAFSRREQYGLVLLSFLIVALLAIRLLLPLLQARAQMEVVSEVGFFEVLEETTEHKSENRAFKKNKNSTHHFVTFDPNTVSVTELSQMGLSPYVIVNWMKFREAGGCFASADDVGKIYGLDSMVLTGMMTYVDIPDGGGTLKEGRSSNGYKKKYSNTPRNKSNEAVSDSPKDIEIIDLNKADAATLQKLDGIGPVFSRRIVDFRNLLGGFYSVEQLREVYGLSPDLVDKIRAHLVVFPKDVVKIDVNSNSLRTLKAHPYINFYQAKEIVEYRRNQGALTDKMIMEDFSSFDEKAFNKVLPYLSFKEKKKQ
ncbi:helix-hairpin-helix domain-containing protein [Marinilabilia sp.]|uniref:helix-hairpin-helix domain-containing protein n=1 Tax=Marinilabilia sp. TaxID=2021252 RepID=UPI0025B82916|nr:helix-hairpin-helix domain-containing protein [Marinilabilia sp.]